MGSFKLYLMLVGGRGYLDFFKDHFGKTEEKTEERGSLPPP